MLGFEHWEVEKILLQLEKMGIFKLERPLKLYQEEGHLSLLGSGNTSFVYEVFDTLNPENHYALKVLGFHGQDIDVEGVTTSVNIQYAASEESDHIVKVYSIWTIKLQFDEAGNVSKIITPQENWLEEDGLFVQMILMEKLQALLIRDKFGNVHCSQEELVTEEGIFKFTMQIGEAIEILHLYNFLHRDIKLENVFWDPKTSVYKLGDFGVAKYVDTGRAETVLYTDGYGAPEIEKRLRTSYDVTADIYSFGMMLYLLLNDLKFPMSESYRVSTVQYEKDFILPAPIFASAFMTKIIRKMCSYEPEDRYKSVQDIICDLILGEESNGEEEENLQEEQETEIYRENLNMQESSVLLDKEEKILDIHKEVSSKKNEGVNDKKQNTDQGSHAFVKQTYEERKKQGQRMEAIYAKLGVRYFFIVALLSSAFFLSISYEAGVSIHWTMMFFPFILILGSFLQKLEEFQFIYFVFTVIFSIYSMYSTKTVLMPLTAIFLVLLGLPAVSAGGAVGIIVYILQNMIGKWNFLTVFEKWSLGWLFAILLIAFIESYIWLRDSYHKKCTKGEIVLIIVLGNLPPLLLIFGIITLLLENFRIISIPNYLKQMHLIKMAIGLFVVQVFNGTYNSDEEIKEV
jgi:non-specific serine/threonine protein kinase